MKANTTIPPPQPSAKLFNVLLIFRVLFLYLWSWTRRGVFQVQTCVDSNSTLSVSFILRCFLVNCGSDVHYLL